VRKKAPPEADQPLAETGNSKEILDFGLKAEGTNQRANSHRSHFQTIENRQSKLARRKRVFVIGLEIESLRGCGYEEKIEAANHCGIKRGLTGAQAETR
jgi:hypothetical protein